MKKLLCFIGIHNWEIKLDHIHPQCSIPNKYCKRCNKEHWNFDY